MNAKLAVLAILAAATVTLTSVAAAGPDAAKQRVAITINDLPEGEFVLTPLQAGALKRDSGTASLVYGPSRVVIREGQKVAIFGAATHTFEGKRGSLTIRERSEWVDVDPGPGYNAATGTWKVMRGTGEYAGITGGGRSVHVARDVHPGLWKARQEGFLTLP